MINRRNSESSSSLRKADFKSRAIPLPGDFVPQERDIVCGRGNAYCHLPGNATFSAIVRSNLQLYIDTPKRSERSLVVGAVLEQILATGSRFVKKDRITKLWYEMSREQAHEKTGHALRDMLRQRDEDGVESMGSSMSSKSSDHKRESKSRRAKRESHESPSPNPGQEPNDNSLSSDLLHSFSSFERILPDTMEMPSPPCDDDMTESNREDCTQLNISPIALGELQENDSLDDAPYYGATIDSSDYEKAFQILSLDED